MSWQLQVYGRVVQLHVCVPFCLLFHYQLPQALEYGPRCSPVGPSWLSALRCLLISEVLGVLTERQYYMTGRIPSSKFANCVGVPLHCLLASWRFSSFLFVLLYLLMPSQRLPRWC